MSYDPWLVESVDVERNMIIFGSSKTDVKRGMKFESPVEVVVGVPYGFGGLDSIASIKIGTPTKAFPCYYIHLNKATDAQCIIDALSNLYDVESGKPICTPCIYYPEDV